VYNLAREDGYLAREDGSRVSVPKGGRLFDFCDGKILPYEYSMVALRFVHAPNNAFGEELVHSL
jgi:hypothetical protein